MHVTCKSDKSSNVMFWFSLSHIVRKNALVIPDMCMYIWTVFAKMPDCHTKPAKFHCLTKYFILSDKYLAKITKVLMFKYRTVLQKKKKKKKMGFR